MMSSLHLACFLGFFDIVEYLVENKADINQKNINGKSPLSIAAENGHLSVVSFLFSMKADINSIDDQFGKKSN